MRALGPLDSLVQAAGRANREGKMSSLGRVIVFVPEDGHTPKGSYQVGTDIATRLLKDGQADLHDPTLYQRYFQEYYSLPYRDHYGIQELREHLNYPEVAQKFRLIDDNSTPVIVTYEPAAEKIRKLLDRLRGKNPHRDVLRALQPYAVNLPKHEFEQAKKNSLVSEIVPDVWMWREDKYDCGKDGKHGQGILFDGTFSADNLLW
jgi:CRISPR-associated endonuclease/helicase Cas3